MIDATQAHKRVIFLNLGVDKYLHEFEEKADVCVLWSKIQVWVWRLRPRHFTSSDSFSSSRQSNIVLLVNPIAAIFKGLMLNYHGSDHHRCMNASKTRNKKMRRTTRV